ncbi:MAG: hypothetical protein OER83_03515 [Flavobacteriaceae bacterium]|nr:hypothetical protein [Flavobacteriaceae bacterium]
MIQSKFWQAFFALAPIIILFGFIICYLLFLMAIFSNAADGGFDHYEDDPFAMMGGITAFFLFIIFVILISLGSLIFYIVHAVQNPNLRGNNLLLVWILLFIFANGIGQMIYWLVEIVSKRNKLQAT